VSSTTFTPVFPKFTADEAVARAQGAVGQGTYRLGGSQDHLKVMGLTTEFDCVGFACCWAYGLPRHQPGFNRGAWSTVEDDINSNSMAEDAVHRADMFQFVAAFVDHPHDFGGAASPLPGDLLVYPTTRAWGIGHAAIIVTPAARLQDMRIVQCVGPRGRRPAILRSDASHFELRRSQGVPVSIVRPRQRPTSSWTQLPLPFPPPFDSDLAGLAQREAGA